MKIKELKDFLDRCVNEYGINDDYDVIVSMPNDNNIHANVLLNPNGKRLILYVPIDHTPFRVMTDAVV